MMGKTLNIYHQGHLIFTAVFVVFRMFRRFRIFSGQQNISCWSWFNCQVEIWLAGSINNWTFSLVTHYYYIIEYYRLQIHNLVIRSRRCSTRLTRTGTESWPRRNGTTSSTPRESPQLSEFNTLHSTSAESANVEEQWRKPIPEYSKL